METKETVRKEAADWLCLMQGEDWNETMQREFDAWVKRSSLHAEVYFQMQNIWNSIPRAVSLRESIQKQSSGYIIKILQWLSVHLFHKQERMWPSGVAVACVLLFGVMVTFGIHNRKTVEWHAFETGVAENKSITLNDGSRVVLGAASSIRWQMNDSTRELVVLTGQAFFDIEKDANRPFFIQAGVSKIEVVGTQFDVRKIQNQTDVKVLEGHVRIHKLITAMSPQLIESPQPIESSQPAGDRQTNLARPANTVSLFAGDQIKLRFGRATENVQKVDLEDIASWKTGRFVYKNADLSEVINDAKRYYSGEINLYGSNLETLKVTTTFNLDQVETMADALEKILPIKVIRDEHNNILIVKDT